MAGATTTIIQEDPSKFYYNFLHKFIIIAIFLLILPLFPSQPPQFIHQSLLTRNWELLHLLFAGIAISYGLFSRRNDNETHKENKFDTTQSYLSRFLHVSSSVYEDGDSDSDHQTPSWDETKIQTWSSSYQYQKVLESSRRICDEKPLLLPVRSLKSSADDDGNDDSSVSKRFLCSKEDNLVLPSPIPWRSESNTKVLLEPRSLVKSQTLDSYGSNSMSFSQSESVSENEEDVMMKKKKKKKSLKIQKSYPPPPPPPPPNPMLFKSISMKPRTSTSYVHQGASFDKGILKRSFTKGDSVMEESEDRDDEDEDEDEDDDGESLMGNEEEEERSRSENGNGGDVDKKADEFIAKFREQIRLQRIDSIKRSAIRITRNSSR